jgi:hypothetical protein
MGQLPKTPKKRAERFAPSGFFTAVAAISTAGVGVLAFSERGENR